MGDAFETALAERTAAMADACTRCGKCVEVCPVTGPGGVKAEPRAVISGIIDILRTGDGPEASRKWASACVLTGECIKACDYGVNPRFLLNMARVAMARRAHESGEQRRQGVEGFRKVAREVTHISQMQLDDELHARHRLQDVLGRFDHALDAGMAVERHAHLDAPLEERPEPIEVDAQE